jgi:hypothetical protein
LAKASFKVQSRTVANGHGPSAPAASAPPVNRSARFRSLLSRATRSAGIRITCDCPCDNPTAIQKKIGSDVRLVTSHVGAGAVNSWGSP